MAKMRFKCACGKMLAVDERFAGKIAKCPACRRPVQVPELPNAPPPKDITPQDMAAKLASLSDAYGAAVLAKARSERVKAALSEYNRKARKRRLIIAASAASVLLLGFIGYKLFKPYGFSPGERNCPQATWPFLSGLSKHDARVRAAATWEVADAGGDEVAWVIQKMAGEPEPVVRLVAVRALGRMDRERAAGSMQPMLEDGELDIRMTAAFVLARCKAGALTRKTLAPSVSRALGDDTEWRRWFEQAAQEATLPSAYTALLDTRSQSRSKGTRAITAWMIAATLGADDRLLGLLRDPEPVVVASTINSLAPFLTVKAFERLRQQDDTEEAGKRMIALQNIAYLLRHEDARVRTAAALALAHCGQDKIAHLLAQTFKDGDWFVRFAGAKGLSAVAPGLALEAIHQARDENSHKHNVWIQRVITRIEQKLSARKPPEEP